jgi:hypothetical protein
MFKCYNIVLADHFGAERGPMLAFSQLPEAVDSAHRFSSWFHLYKQCATLLNVASQLNKVMLLLTEEDYKNVLNRPWGNPKGDGVKLKHIKAQYQKLAERLDALPAFAVPDP